MKPTPVQSILRADLHYQKCQMEVVRSSGRLNDWRLAMMIVCLLTFRMAFVTGWSLTLSLPLGAFLYYLYRLSKKQNAEAKRAAVDALDDFRVTLEDALEQEREISKEALEELRAH